MDHGDRVEREVRAAQNQALFRTENERLEALAEAFQFISEGASFACECADVACVKQMRLSMDEYEALRKHANRFAVLPGHVYADVERVAADNGRYVVVEKIGKGAEVAAQFDPRSHN